MRLHLQPANSSRWARAADELVLALTFNASEEETAVEDGMAEMRRMEERSTTLEIEW